MKARFNVFPSAYGAGRRDALNVAMALHYSGVDPAEASSQEIVDALGKIGRNVSVEIFAARIKNVKPGDFKENTFKLEKEGRLVLGWLGLAWLSRTGRQRFCD